MENLNKLIQDIGIGTSKLTDNLVDLIYKELSVVGIWLIFLHFSIKFIKIQHDHNFEYLAQLVLETINNFISFLHEDKKDICHKLFQNLKNNLHIHK